MRRALALLGFLAASAALPASAQMTPGTVKLLTKNTVLTDGTSGDPFVEIQNDLSAKFLIIGPETLQADLRVNLAPGETSSPPALLIVLAAGKEVARFRLNPKGGADSWRGRTDVKPGASIGFYVAIDPGPHAYEFRIQGAPRGAGLLLVPKAKAKRALPAGAAVVPAKPQPVATPTPLATAVAAATPAPTPASTPIPLEALKGTGAKADELRRARRTYEASLKAVYATPAHEEFDATVGFGGEARWAFGKRRLFAVGVEAQTLAWSALLPDDPDRLEPARSLDVQLVPVSLNGTWIVPFESRFQPYLSGGGTLAMASSVLRERDRRTRSESVLGFGAHLSAGVQLDFYGNEYREGGQKLFLEVKGSYLDVPFEEHVFTDWSSVQVLGGVALKF